MERIAVSELRANLMNVLQRIQAGQSVTITSRGREIARLVPPDRAKQEARAALAKLRKSAQIGDVISPIDADWEENL